MLNFRDGLCKMTQGRSSSISENFCVVFKLKIEVLHENGSSSLKKV